MKEARIILKSGKELSIPYEIALTIQSQLNKGSSPFLCVNDQNSNYFILLILQI